MACQFSTETYKEGRKLYSIHCSGCHGIQFEGLGKLYPGLNSGLRVTKTKKDIICIIKNGSKNDLTDISKTNMPEFKYLKDVQICNILNYINSENWNFTEFTLQEVNHACN